VAFDLLICYCKDRDQELLKNIYLYTDQQHETGIISVTNAYDSKEDQKMLENLSIANQIFSKNKKYAFHAKQTEDQIKLLRVQTDLESQSETTFRHLSLGDTLSKLVELTLYQKAAKLAKDFKVPDNRYWWIQIRAISKSGKWTVLQELAKKRSPIGYGPFVDVCIQYRNWIEAEKYTSMITDPQTKLKYLVKQKRIDEACNIALQLKDPNLLLDIRTKCSKDQLPIVEKYLSQFK